MLGVILIVITVSSASSFEESAFGIARVFDGPSACVETNGSWQPQAGDKLKVITFGPTAVGDAVVDKSADESCREFWADSVAGRFFHVRLVQNCKIGTTAIVTPDRGTFRILKSGEVMNEGASGTTRIRFFRDKNGEPYFGAERRGKIVWREQDWFYPLQAGDI